jgi:hypothetical protein
MEIYKENFFKIFKANFNFEIVETDLGTAIKMPAKEAFIYSSVTGAGYLENPIYPFTPKGLMKLFYNAFNYKFVSGIFDNGVLKNTPFILSRAKQYLFEGDKFIVPIEFESEEKLNDMLKAKFGSLKNRENYIIQRIETSKQGNGMEPFMEYLAGEYFRHLGFIVENQIPLAHAIGSPDFAGYGLSEIITKISNYGYLPIEGFHMIELALIRNFKKDVKTKAGHVTHNFIVGEAKTGTVVMTKQLEKYLNTGLFDQGFEICPAKAKPSKDYFGLISLDSDYKIKITLPEAKYDAKNPLSREEYTTWLGNYIKFYLIANFTNDELKQFHLEVRGEEINKESDLVSFVLGLETETILEKIKSLK